MLEEHGCKNKLNMLGIAVHACNPGKLGGWGRRTTSYWGSARNTYLCLCPQFSPSNFQLKNMEAYSEMNTVKTRMDKLHDQASQTPISLWSPCISSPYWNYRAVQNKHSWNHQKEKETAWDSLMNNWWIKAALNWMVTALQTQKGWPWKALEKISLSNSQSLEQ